MSDLNKKKSGVDRLSSMTTVSVEVPFDKVEELENFAARLRGEHPFVAAVFKRRPTKDLRIFMREVGMKYSDGVWQGEIPPFQVEFVKGAVLAAGAKVFYRRSDLEILKEKKILEMSKGLPISRLEMIKLYEPYDFVEATKAVEAIFQKYKNCSDPARELARDTNSRVRSHFVLSRNISMELPKKALMVAALRQMNRIADLDSSLFSASEAKKFFDELGYDTVIK